MSWRTAFLRQAKSDEFVRQFLADELIDTCHRLHYLQMVTEKLAKGMLADENDIDPPAFVHNGFVRFLQVLKGERDLRRRLGFRDAKSFAVFIDSLLDLARWIESLAPSIAGSSRPNPEYPWWDSGSGKQIAPADYRYSDLRRYSSQLIKLEN